MNRSVTDGILEAFERGLLTSAAILSNGPDAVAAIARWKSLLSAQAAGSLPSQPMRRRLDDPDSPFELGVHLNLTQGRPLTGARFPHQLLDREGCFLGIGPLFARLAFRGTAWRRALAEELSAQIAFAQDHGIRPTHLNGHQYVEMRPEVVDIVPTLLQRHGIRHVRVPLESGLARSVLFEGRPFDWRMGLAKR